MRRLAACLTPRAAVLASDDAPLRAVEAVLQSCHWHEVLGLSLAIGSDAGQSDTPIVAAGAEGDTLETGLTLGPSGLDGYSDDDIVQEFLRIAVEVHPFRNGSADSMLALRWAVDAFVNLRSRSLRMAAMVDMVRRGNVHVRDQECVMDEDEALHIFSETSTRALDRLSVHDLGRGGVGKMHADVLLNSVHILHLRPQSQGSRPGTQERAILDSVLAGALAANWLAARFARLLSWPSRRAQAETYCSTLVAAVGGVAFSGASRLQRMLTESGGAIVGSTGDMQGPSVQCPLCRVASVASRAIRNVRAGESAPICCVCTEAQSDVCLPCGHLCLCQECFRRLPRSVAASGLT